jgi:bifunctional UDP-N-acetylglucosamine pyrophosphorylase / glucosamine-1-phosphate N-acetyltransferase
MTNSAIALVLAAGKGTRMKSDLPKVLFPVCGRPMLQYVVDALEQSGLRRTILVVGYRAELVRETVNGRAGVEFALQAEQLGTGHAVMVCRPLLADYDGPVLVVTGDAPLIQATTINALLAEFERTKPSCLLGTIRKDNPAGLGRVVRDAQGEFLAIVEDKDATPEQKQITEVNMSYYVFDCRDLLAALDHIRADNVQAEYYLTDVPGVLKAQGKPVRALCALQPCEALGVNTIDELAAVEAALRAQNRGAQA